jgi:hypothetical protein
MERALGLCIWLRIWKWRGREGVGRLWSEMGKGRGYVVKGPTLDRVFIVRDSLFWLCALSEKKFT